MKMTKRGKGSVGETEDACTIDKHLESLQILDDRIDLFELILSHSLDSAWCQDLQSFLCGFTLKIRPN